MNHNLLFGRGRRIREKLKKIDVGGDTTGRGLSAPQNQQIVSARLILDQPESLERQ
jgi:hypothetical protein